MTLVKAIDIGELNIMEAGKQMPPEALNALKLLVEAGKRLRRQRHGSPEPTYYLLPGETKED